MRLRRIGLTALITILAILENVDVSIPALGRFILNPESKSPNSQVLAQTVDERKAEGDRLRQQGIQQAQTGQFEAALQSWQQALIIYRQLGDRYREGITLNDLGRTYNALGDYIKAIEFYQQALSISRELGLRQAERATLDNLGIAYSNLGDYVKAIEYQQQSLAILREMNDRQGEETSLGNLGNAYSNLEDYPTAIEFYKQALIISQEIKNPEGEGASLVNLGVAYSNLGEYTKAIDYYQQSLAILRQIKDRLGEGDALGNLGVAYYYLGNYSKAIDYQQQRLAIAKSIKDQRGEGHALNNLGLAYNALGDYGTAIDYYQKSLALARAIKDRKYEGQALGNLGVAYHLLGDYVQAIDYQQQRLAIAKSIKDLKGEGQALGNLGNTYDLLGDYSTAIDYYQKSLALARAIKDRKGEGQTLGNLGNTYYNLGDYTKAIDYQQQRLAIAKSIKDLNGEGQALTNLGNAYYALGDYAKAIDYHQQSLAIKRDIKDRKGEGGSLNNLGLAYNALGDYVKAIDYHQQHLVIAREIGDKNWEGISLTNLGNAMFQTGNLTQAEKILRDGIEVWESIRKKLGENDAYKVSIFERQALTYQYLQKVLIAQNQPLPALLISERGRARAFVELLAKRNATTSDSTNTTIAKPTIDQLQQIAKQQNATLVEYSIIYDEFKIKSKQETHESELYIWVIKPTGEITFRRSNLKPLWQQNNTSLSELVTTSRESIGVRSRGLGAVAKVDDGTQTNRLQQLHQILIQPIADLLPTNPEARVIFIPQSSLFLVPFPALKDEQGKYLIEKHTILTAPSIQVLELTRKQRENLPPLTKGGTAGVNLVVGNPTMPSVPPYPGEKPQQLAPLPGAEDEAKAIAPLLNTQPLIGNQATESVIKQRLPQARIIHLATHGLLDDIRGIGSAIALTPDSLSSPLGKGGQEGGNGLLTAEEILDLKLNAELAVLSACDTGRGRITGDGVVGLSRSLISAGVSSVIVSLWAVPDAPTASLMTEFYNNIQQRQLDKAQALRQAMLTTMKQHPNPKNWAAFTLIGEAE